MNCSSKSLRTVPVLLALAVLLLPGVLAAQVEPQPVGSWIVKVMPQAPGDPVFVNLSTLHQDGTMVSFEPASPVGSTFSSGYVGVWRREQSGRYEVLFVATMYDGDALIGYKRVRATIALSQDGAQFSGTFTLDILDENEQPLASIPGTVSARRIRF